LHHQFNLVPSSSSITTEPTNDWLFLTFFIYAFIS
jgi:hypothetical protein